VTGISFEVSLLDEEELRTFIVANWIYAGQVRLTAGKNLSANREVGKSAGGENGSEWRLANGKTAASSEWRLASDETAVF